MWRKKVWANNNHTLSLVALMLTLVVMQDGVHSSLLTKNFLVSVNDICTGVVVSEFYVLAPSKCVEPISKSLLVRYEVNDLDDPSGGKKIRAKLAACHHEAEEHNHLCLLKLVEKIKPFDPSLRANYVRLFPQDHEDPSQSSELYLMGYEEGENGGCAGPKREVRMKFEPDVEMCGYESGDPIICTTTNADLAPYCGSLQCSGFLIEKQFNILGLGGFRLLVGLPVANKGDSSKNARAFVNVSKYTNWIRKNTEDGAHIYLL